MIAKVVYGRATEEAAAGLAMSMDMMVTAQIIDCARLYPMENETHWGFMAYDNNDKLIAQHKFEMSDITKVYIMEGGKTIDVLPRR